MVEIQVQYNGDLRCTATHGPSGSTLSTDAPTDNLGKGELFSPTDLVATALATCVVTTMGIVAKRKNFDFSRASARVEKHMVADPVRRIGELKLFLRIPGNWTEDQKKMLTHTANACPVKNSLHPDTKVTIELAWE